ncbi:MAG: adenylate/guanylate cyclase domain-containing protein [Geminicoccaceae bacterium]
MSTERRLIAVLAADVAGYSRLMAADEPATVATLAAHRETMDALIAGHRGRIANTAGDSVLAEFASVVDAVECARAIQEALAQRNADLAAERRMPFRIGLHVGDVMVRGGDLFGDTVNVAARIQALADPGGVAVSEDIRRHVGNRLPLGWSDGGSHAVKNIAEPVHIHHLAGIGGAEARPAAPALPDRPSIAVLPFQNMSGDPEQDYFADGMVEEITTALSRLRWLFVIARNSAFTYKGRAVDVKQVGRELGVRYVLEGSVRRAGSRVRITGQLLDAAGGTHIWAERFDGALEDVFDLQDRVAESVVAAIGQRIEQAEIDRARRKPTGRQDAYDLYLRGLAAVHSWTREGNDEAIALFRRATELDPGFAAAFGMAARCYSQRKASGWVTDRTAETAEAERLARRAVALGRDDPVALGGGGIALAFVVGDVEAGEPCIERALALDPNFAWGWLFGAWTRAWEGDPAGALERAARAMRLSPTDPHMFSMRTVTAVAHFFAGRDDEALAWAGQAARERPGFLIATAVTAAAAAHAGRQAEAAAALQRLLAVEPTLRIANLTDHWPIRRPEDLARWRDGLRLAGLPE